MPSGGRATPTGLSRSRSPTTSAFDDALPRLRRDGQHAAGTYRGVAYDKDDDRQHRTRRRSATSTSVGTLAGLRAAIDASKGSSLADASRYTDAVAERARRRARIRLRRPEGDRRGSRRLNGAPANARKALARFADADPVVASLTATADEIAIEASGGGRRSRRR